jgi:hypothetical protein
LIFKLFEVFLEAALFVLELEESYDGSEEEGLVHDLAEDYDPRLESAVFESVHILVL